MKRAKKPKGVGEADIKFEREKEKGRDKRRRKREFRKEAKLGREEREFLGKGENREGRIKLRGEKGIWEEKIEKCRRDRKGSIE